MSKTIYAAVRESHGGYEVKKTFLKKERAEKFLKAFNAQAILFRTEVMGIYEYLDSNNPRTDLLRRFAFASMSADEINLQLDVLAFDQTYKTLRPRLDEIEKDSYPLTSIKELELDEEE